MIRLKNNEEIKILRQGGKILSAILKELAGRVAAGVKTIDLNDFAIELCKQNKVIPTFLNYRARKMDKPFPAALCVSVNDQVVHGAPNARPEYRVKEGDLVSIDLGLEYQGMFLDAALTVGIGKIDSAGRKLLDATKEALIEAIKIARVGNKTGDIGAAIEKVAKKYGLSTLKELGGHGVGHAVHEDPFIPNFAIPGEGVILKEGMVLAIEPMLNEGGPEIVLDDDGFTYRTLDGKRSAHFEHTVVITKDGPEILTMA